ncbi:type II toxin-antitoxin system HicB family antitoxin [Mesorhizobium sp. WSM4935]|uniref:type II toxin-antitoxin system HicB family antitoxin n=1 Tax=Mesorhizobium sp. WSM4935 TaxID=3038547 RepID=UPI0024150D95|nr:type II toxin-antitoxin system HicB family antitoxin [Mesorhizobium sp. WSM4935]MDG4874181.1 type II toxin-antitoxin system HicB family antitoxin [Mesorhizobium sp. WSM4935]
MSRYIALIDFADGAYGVIFPDAPGCTAMGATLDEAIADATNALAEWVAEEIAEGRHAPRPRPIEELLADKDVRSAQGQGAVLASVPLLKDSGRLARANISMDAGLLADIDEAAQRQGVTRSAFIAAAARERIRMTA